MTEASGFSNRRALRDSRRRSVYVHKQTDALLVGGCFLCVCWCGHIRVLISTKRLCD